MIFSIGGLRINFEGSNEYFTDRSSAFLESNSGKNCANVDMQLSMEMVDKISIPEGELVLEDNTKILRKTSPEQGYYIFKTHEDSVTTMALLETNRDWSVVKLKYVPTEALYYMGDDSYLGWSIYHSFFSFGVAYRYLLIKNNGIAIHSSSIEMDGKGLIVSAASGTGKSTHTRLWKELYGEKVTYVNDDRPAVRFIDNVPMLCGTPWSGQSDLFSNVMVPLNCIVMLEQSQVNSIERLPMDKALQLLIPRCFLPYFDRDLMEEAMCVLDKLIGEIPVYLLKCRPDYEAVELVRKCMN